VRTESAAPAHPKSGRVRFPDGRQPRRFSSLTAGEKVDHRVLDDARAKKATGADRFERLDRAATRAGEWTAVNSFTVLVGMRRSALAAERTAAQAELAALPADAPGRADLTARIESSRTLETSLNRGLQGQDGENAASARISTSPSAMLAGSRSWRETAPRSWVIGRAVVALATPSAGAR